MIIVVGKVQVRRGLDSELPGAPVSQDPISYSPALDIGEFGYGQDSGRLFIGHDPANGNPNFGRPVFPYQNIEVLTENSPRVGELFSMNVRDQDRNDFYVPTVLAPSVGYVPLTYAEYDGAFAIPARFYGTSISATVDYHAFQNDLPLKNGTLRIMATGAGSPPLLDDGFEKVGGPYLQFQMGARQQDSGGYFYDLNAWNMTAQPITIIIRRTVIIGMSA